MDPNDTSLGAAQANIRASSDAQCELLNRNLKFIYLGAFNNWKLSVDAGRISNENPPKPPASWVLEPSTDINGNVWYFPEQTGPPVCDMPPIPEDHSKSQQQIRDSMPPNTMDLGNSADEGAGVWWAAGPKDTYKNGAVVVTPAGKFQKVASPVGGGWWKLMS